MIILLDRKIQKKLCGWETKGDGEQTRLRLRHTKQYNLSLSALLLLCVCLCTFSLFLCLFFNWWFYFPAARTRHIWSSGHSQSNGSCGDRWRDRAGRAPPPARSPFAVWFQQTDGGDPDVSQGATPCIHKVENRQRQTPSPAQERQGAMAALRESRKRLQVWNKLKLFSPRESFPTRKKEKRNPNKSRRVCTAYGYRSSNRIADSWLAQHFRELGYLMCGKPLTVLRLWLLVVGGPMHKETTSS